MNGVNGKRIAYLKSSCDADHFEHKHDKVILKKYLEYFPKNGQIFKIMKNLAGLAK